MAEPRAGKEQVALSGMIGIVESVRERPTFNQMVGAQLLRLLLWVICGLVVAFLASWLFTRPALLQVRTALGEVATPTEVLDTLRELRRDHFEQFRDFCQLLILSVLLPMVTLFAGYTFGVRQDERNKASDASETES